MTSMGQSRRAGMGPEPLEHLLGKLEDDGSLGAVRRPLGAAARRRHERHADAIHGQVDRICRPAAAQLRSEPLGGKSQGREHLLQ